MIKLPLYFFMFFTLLFMLGSCGVVETVFKAGMWWAFFLVGLVVVLILVLISKMKK